MLSFLAVLNSLVNRRVGRDDKGATAVEYGLMVALIAVAIMVTVGLIGTELNALFARVLAALVAA